jgi:hypothetical protein
MGQKINMWFTQKISTIGTMIFDVGDWYMAERPFIVVRVSCFVIRGKAHEGKII